MNAFTIILILTFINTAIALFGYPFPFWFDRWFVFFSGVVILVLLILEIFKKRARQIKQEEKSQEYNTYEEAHEVK